MRFSVLTGNHGSGNVLSDMVTFVNQALLDCGHDSRIDADPVAGRINVVIENFRGAAIVRRFQQAHEAGVRFVIIATERMSGGTFNPDVAPGDRHYGNLRYWSQRYSGFMAVARLAEAIWAVDESMFEPYRAALPDKPVLFLPHGWVSHFERVRCRDESEEDIDFYSSGVLTAHRRSVFLALEDRGYRVQWDHASSVPDYIRLDHVSRSRVCLSLKLSPGSEVPSVSRLHFLLQNRRTAAIEQCTRRCPLDPYVQHLPGESLVAACEALLARSDRRSLALRSAERFAAEMPMSRLLPPILEASLAGLSADPMRVTGATEADRPSSRGFRDAISASPGLFRRYCHGLASLLSRV